MFYIIDRVVKNIHAVILSFAALVGLFVLPPAGIILLLYLRGFLRYGAIAE
jgi:hypothetical protein